MDFNMLNVNSFLRSTLLKQAVFAFPLKSKTCLLKRGACYIEGLKVWDIFFYHFQTILRETFPVIDYMYNNGACQVDYLMIA